MHVIKPGSHLACDSHLLTQLTQLWLMSLAGDLPKLSGADNRKQNRKRDCTCPARSSQGVERVAGPYAVRHVSQLGAAGRHDRCMDGHQAPSTHVLTCRTEQGTPLSLWMGNSCIAAAGTVQRCFNMAIGLREMHRIADAAAGTRRASRSRMQGRETRVL